MPSAGVYMDGSRCSTGVHIPCMSWWQPKAQRPDARQRTERKRDNRFPRVPTQDRYIMEQTKPCGTHQDLRGACDYSAARALWYCSTRQASKAVAERTPPLTRPRHLRTNRLRRESAKVNTHHQPRRAAHPGGKEMRHPKAIQIDQPPPLTSTSSIVRGHRRAGSRRTSSCWSLARRITVLRQTELAAATRPRARAAATWVACRPANTAELLRVVGDRTPPPPPPLGAGWDTTAAVTSANRCSSCRATSPVGNGGAGVVAGVADAGGGMMDEGAWRRKRFGRVPIALTGKLLTLGWAVHTFALKTATSKHLV